MHRRMVRSVIGFFLLIVLTFPSILPIASAAMHSDETEASALKELGIILGDSNGFSLERAPTRVETAVILLRLLGKEEEAAKRNYESPFDDVPAWASAAIGYLYQKNIVKGVGERSYGTGNADFNQVMTMLLRALGYQDNGEDFVWDKAAEKALELDILTPYQYYGIRAQGTFTRKEFMTCILSALLAKSKERTDTLIKQLLDAGVVTKQQIIKAGLIDLNVAAGLSKNTYTRYQFQQKFTLKPDHTATAWLKVNLPVSYYNRQNVLGYTFSVEPSEFLYEDGLLYAAFYFEGVSEDITIEITTDVELTPYAYGTLEDLAEPVALTDEEYKRYTSPSEYIESDNAAFTQVDFQAEGKDQWELVKDIAEYVIQRMQVRISPDDTTALQALRKGYGDCLEFSAVFTAFCRANNIPARQVIGVWPDAEATGHAITEVFLDDFGWIPIDIVNIAAGSATLKRLTPMIYLNKEAYGSAVLYHRNYYVGAISGGSWDIEESVSKVGSPAA